MIGRGLGGSDSNPSSRNPRMVSNTRRQAARPEGAADVNVDARLDIESAEPADLDSHRSRAFQDQRVRVGLLRHAIGS